MIMCTHTPRTHTFTRVHTCSHTSTHLNSRVVAVVFESCTAHAAVQPHGLILLCLTPHRETHVSVRRVLINATRHRPWPGDRVVQHGGRFGVHRCDVGVGDVMFVHARSTKEKVYFLCIGCFYVCVTNYLYQIPWLYVIYSIQTVLNNISIYNFLCEFVCGIATVDAGF